MKLKLIFEGEEPISIKLVADVLRSIDKRVFVHEKKQLKILKKQFPDITSEQIALCRQELDREYRAKQFTMLEVESINKGSYVFLAVVSAAVYWTLEKILGATITEVWKGVVLKPIKRFFIDGQKGSLITAVREVGIKYNQQDAVQRLVENRQIEAIKFPSLKWGNDTFEVSLGEILYSKNNSQLAVAGGEKRLKTNRPKVNQPLEILVFRDMKLNEPAHGQHTLDVVIQRITVKVPPISYSKLVDDYNNEPYREDIHRDDIDE